MPLDAVWSVIQGGVPADFLLGLTLQAMERYRNMGLYAGQSHPADPEFGRILRLLRSIQQSHALDSDLVKQLDRTEVWVTFPGPHSVSGPVAEQIAELKALLHIPGGHQPRPDCAWHAGRQCRRCRIPDTFSHADPFHPGRGG